VISLGALAIATSLSTTILSTGLGSSSQLAGRSSSYGTSVTSPGITRFFFVAYRPTMKYLLAKSARSRSESAEAATITLGHQPARAR